MNDFLVFKASTNVKNLIGKDLVTDQITAVFELVKNSYDADANRVDIEFLNITTEKGKIIIRDDGTGMNLEDIQKYWMVIGSENKKGKDASPKFSRPLNGDKGVGRFSVDRLGRHLHLNAVKEGYSEAIELEVDWTQFENEYNDLSTVQVPYRFTKANGSGAGLTLAITSLRDEWNKASIERLIKSLRHFKSPFRLKDDFEIIVHAPEFFDGPVSISPYHLEDMSSLWVRTEIMPEDCSKIRLIISRDGVEYREEHPNHFNFGPVVSQVYYFDASAKLKFHNRMKMRVIEFGNIRLYRDEFRIHPYGEQWNDWLGLDRRKAQGSNRFFGTRELVGFVQITKKDNQCIEVLTNRQGLIENVYYAELREFIIENCIKVLEKYYFKKPKNEIFEKSKRDVEIAVVELKKFTQNIAKNDPEAAKMLRQITNVVQKSQSEQSEFVRNQEELISVYKRVASKEVLLHHIVHQALIRIERVKTVSGSGQRIIEDHFEESTTNSEIDELMKTVNRKFTTIDQLTDDAKGYLMKVRDHLIRKKEKKTISLLRFTNDLLGTFSDSFSQSNIKATLEGADVSLYVDRDDLQSIIENFISNSIKSLNQVTDRERLFKINIVSNPQSIVIVFKDNGIGIPDHLRDRIFDPFFSTTDGFGMGLAIVDEIVKEYRGELNLGINYDLGVEFQIKFRK